MSKLNRVRTGCWTCKQRHRKCDEGKPECLNCTKSKRKCEGYDLRLCFDVDDKRNKNRKNGTAAYGFIGRPKMHKVVKKEDKPSRSNDKEIPLNQAFPLVQANQMANTSSTTLTPGTIPPTKLSNDTFQQLSFELFEDLEYLLNNPSGEMPEETIPLSYEMDSKRSNLDASPHTGHNLPKIFSAASTTTVSEISHGNTLFDSPVPGVATPMGADPADTDLKLTYQEENMMLKHFFQKLLPLLDAHPNSPWPDLALKYCDFNIARSCFISLACMHLYESKKNQSRNPRDAFEAVYERGAYSPDSDFNYDLNTLQEYYKKGMQHINSTMELLVNFVNENAGLVILSSVDKKRQISAFVILLLINVHILFTVLEEGKSALVRFYFKVFSSICNDKHFFDNVVRENDKKKSLVVVLSWYDTVCAVVSPDCRLPVCLEEWYGTSTNSDMKHIPDDIDSHRNEETFRTDLENSQNESYANGTTITGISTAKMMGCPGQIFRAMARVCYIRHVLHYNKPYGGIHADYEEIKQTLVNYRDYVVFDIDENVETSEAFSSSLRAAQCWSLAVYITLERTVKFPSSQVRIRQLVNEFIDTYSGMDPLSPLVSQMVWPVYAVGCECRSPYEQSRLLQFMDTLYRNVKMGTLFSLRHIVQSVWELGITQEEYLRQWLPKDVDYLPL